MQGSATLSMAYAGALFAEMCLRGLNGEPNVEEYAFVQSTVVPGLPFFSSKVKLGPTGARLEPCLPFLQRTGAWPAQLQVSSIPVATGLVPGASRRIQAVDLQSGRGH